MNSLYRFYTLPKPSSVSCCFVNCEASVSACHSACLLQSTHPCHVPVRSEVRKKDEPSLRMTQCPVVTDRKVCNTTEFNLSILLSCHRVASNK